MNIFIHKHKKVFSVLQMMVFLPLFANAQITLIGENLPHKSVNDGDFTTVWANWRLGKQSPFWNMKAIKVTNSENDAKMGLFYGKMFSSNDESVAESKLLNNIPEYQKMHKGDIFKWSFGADLEYRCKGTLSVSLVFGNRERVLAKNVNLIGSDNKDETFSGTYTLNKDDVDGGFPFIRVRFYSENGIKVYLDYINISVYSKRKTAPLLFAKAFNNRIELSWKDSMFSKKDSFFVYRQEDKKKGYLKIASTKVNSFSDTKIINGKKYHYIITRKGDTESGPSNIVDIASYDKTIPGAPQNLKTRIYDSEIKLSWDKSVDNDVCSYSVFRGDENGNNMLCIAPDVATTYFEDIMAPKGVNNTYVVYSKDYSGNTSDSSLSKKAKVNIVYGASFSDLILPMPIIGNLRNDLWGAKNVLPRDKDNGMESPDWSYWGGCPVYDKSDGKYHIVITRWPEKSLKGHWEWPFSTVAHVVSDNPMGPYKVKDEIAYSYENGRGHNPDIIKLKDGTFALYSLINWVPTIFTSKTMNGPWKRLGTISIDSDSINPQNINDYQYSRNLSGVELNDGTIIMVSKFGSIMISKNGLLGPYNVLTKTIQNNLTIPEIYRHSNYEDPVIWKDEVQFHMIINAFLDKRAIYLRSGDGINWVFDPGLAYTPDFTYYENGVKNKWDKLERPHVIQDKYGRACYLSLAVIDVPKEFDYGNDNHNSKNIIIPLTVSKRIKLLNDKIDKNTQTIKILLMSEEGFDATKDVDIASLRFGVPSEVNFGRGCKAINYKKVNNDLMIEFNVKDNELQDEDFVLKLLGKTTKKKLLIGYAKINK